MEDMRKKWADRLQNMKDNRAKESDTNTDAENYLIDQMIANTAEIIRDFAPIDLADQVKELTAENERLKDILTEMMDTCNPYSSPARDWRTSNFKDGTVGSRGIPSEASIIKAKEALQNK